MCGGSSANLLAVSLMETCPQSKLSPGLILRRPRSDLTGQCVNQSKMKVMRDFMFDVIYSKHHLGGRLLNFFVTHCVEIWRRSWEVCLTIVAYISLHCQQPLWNLAAINSSQKHFFALSFCSYLLAPSSGESLNSHHWCPTARSQRTTIKYNKLELLIYFNDSIIHLAHLLYAISDLSEDAYVYVKKQGSTKKTFSSDLLRKLMMTNSSHKA